MLWLIILILFLYVFFKLLLDFSILGIMYLGVLFLLEVIYFFKLIFVFNL